MIKSTQIGQKRTHQNLVGCTLNNPMGNDHPKTQQPILVTGATGFIASHVVEILLCQGYKVRGSVRSLQNKDKTAHLQKLKNSSNLTLVEAELTNAESWDSAVSGCGYVIHIASPIPPNQPEDENELIKPAVEGATNVFKASIKHKVKRFVFTSSCLSLYFGHEKELLDEGMWADPTKCTHYSKSKILAEKAIWDIYYSQNLQHQHTEMVSALPSLVFGPGVSAHGNFSEGFILELIKGNLLGIPTPDVTYAIVDVRDAALGHCLSLFQPNIDGQRIALSAGSIKFSEIAHILHKNFPEFPIKTGTVTADELKNSGNQIAIQLGYSVGNRFEVNNAKSIEKLGMKYRPLEETVVDMGRQLKKLQIV